VLVHGFLDLAFTWHEIAEQLATRAHVIAPDLRGHGDSDWVGAGGYYHFFDYVADLDDVIAQTARPRVVLVGHSMGGSIAGYWAGTRPERLARLALLEGLGPPDQAEVPLPQRTAMWIGAWREARKQYKAMPSIEVAAARLRKNDPLLAEPLSLRLAAEGTRAIEGGVTWKHDPLHMTIGPYPFRRDGAAQFWSRIRCPTLIVDGAQSQLNLSADERAQRRAYFADHRHVTLDGAGHMLQRHQPDQLAHLLGELV
jgi:pimeloyl-ACP methyl ester carboxylesterase